MWSEELEADGEIGSFVAGDGAGGDTDAADASEVGADGVDVGEVVAQRVAFRVTKFPGGAGTDRAEDGVDFLEGRLKFLLNDGADLLCAGVVGVVVSGAENVGAEDDAAFYFGSESGATAGAVHVDDACALVDAVAVADTVEAGEV